MKKNNNASFKELKDFDIKNVWFSDLYRMKNESVNYAMSD